MATTPLFSLGNAKVAEGDAIIMSQFMIISQPPPKHMPFTVAMVGFRPVRLEKPPKPEADVG